MGRSWFLGNKVAWKWLGIVLFVACTEPGNMHRLELGLHITFTHS